MELKHIMLPWLLLPFLLSVAFNISKEDPTFLNRLSAIQTIHTKYGDIFDCVDINKQPSFDHPSLKDHKIQMTPSSFPKGTKVKDAQMVTTQTLGLPGGFCLDGTIPIRRTEMGDIKRVKLLSKFRKRYTRESNDLETESDYTGHQWAFLHNSYSGNFYGTEVRMNVWSPQITNNSTFSLAQFWIMAGRGAEFNTIEGGWTVNVHLYGDRHPRLFVYWTADNYKTGCYNLECPGFVQVSQKVFLGSVMEPVSTYEGTQYETKFLVMKDPETGNWWLYIGAEAIGYWPKAIFTRLQGSAEFVQWGGEVYNPPSNDKWPPMGSGQFAVEGYAKACYMRQMKLVDGNNELIPLPLDAVQFASEPCYTVEDASEEDERIFYFGGPGGYQC